MVYKIIVSLSAEEEIDAVIDYYQGISPNISGKFVTRLQDAYQILGSNPYFRLRYKNFRALPIKGFPLMLFYTIKENKQEIIIYSCFHTSKSPQRYPK